MAKPLVIVESGAKAKTIAGFLGADRYTVMASVGHIRDLPRGAKYAPKNVTKPEVRRLGIDVDDHFTPIYVVPDDKKQVVSQLKAALKDASELYLATDEDREGEAISWHLLEVLKPTRSGEAHGVPRDHQRGDRGGHRQLARPRHEVGRGAGRSPHPRPAVRLRGLERRVPTHRPGHVGGTGAERRDASRRRPRARPHGVPQRFVLGPRGRVRRRRARVPRDARHARRQAPRVGPRLQRRHGSVEPERRRRAARRGRRDRAGDAPAGPAVHGRLGRDPSSLRTPQGAVHHVDPAAGGRPKARLQLGAHDARGPGALRAWAHHVHADRLHLALRAGGQRRPQPDPQHVRRGLPPRPAAPVPQQGEERTGGARGDPARRRPHAHRRRRRPRAQRYRRASPLRPHLEAHGRVADGRRPHPAGHPPARRHLHRRRGGRVPSDRPHHRVPRLPACLRRGRRRPGRRARGPRGDSPAARGGRDGRVPRAEAVRSHHPTAGALHRGEPGEGARGPRHRTPVHVRVGDRDHPPPRLRVQEGERARPHVDRVRQGAAAGALLLPPHRLRVHRDHGGGARRDRSRRGRSREVAPLLLLRQRPGRLARPRGGGAPRADRQGRGQRRAHRGRR